MAQQVLSVLFDSPGANARLMEMDGIKEVPRYHNHNCNPQYDAGAGGADPIQRASLAANIKAASRVVLH